MYCQIQTEIEESRENHYDQVWPKSNQVWKTRHDLNQIPYDYTVEVKNRFKELDLIDRVPEKLWMEVRDIVQEAVIKTILKEKKPKKAKWFSEEALQIAEKRREAEGKGEKKRYTHLNAEFQRIAGRDKESLPQWSVQRNRGK